MKLEFELNQKDLDKLQEMFNVALDQALERHAIKQQLPPLLTMIQFMELFDISRPKATELINRRDFPVLRSAGHPRIPTKQLFEWIDRNTEWTVKESNHLTKSIV
ncbi:helix-turn-helix domain-containing protein [Jeotgalibacillus malaysiensis]|uniref:helix-turn-helix domain-containing protein n=1 Tax=Jeotgalibacillus malaysiensis TaxID=1508404 RepID=UPI00384F0FF7